MVFFNYSTMQMAAKVVYYGPGLCGKTTNLQHIYSHTSNSSRGEMVSLETETDRTLFFDLLPLEVGNIQGFKTRIQLYTVPGQVFYNTTRKLVLKGVDGIVFVADSQRPMLQANIESLQNLRTNLAEIGLTLDEVPLVFQYNKRDLGDICTVQELDQALNPEGRPSFEASALTGEGVFDTLKGISKLTLLRLKERLQTSESSSTKTPATAPSPSAAPPTQVDHVSVVDEPEVHETSDRADAQEIELDPPATPAATAETQPPQETAPPAPAAAASRLTSAPVDKPVEAVEPTKPVDAPTPAASATSSRQGGVDILAELEKIRQRAKGTTTPQAEAEPVHVNGHSGREIEKKFSFLLDHDQLQSTRRLRFSLTVENADHEVVENFEEEIRIESLKDLDELMLRLEIALAAGQAERPGRVD